MFKLIKPCRGYLLPRARYIHISSTLQSSSGIGIRRKPLKGNTATSPNEPTPRAMLSAEESQRIPQGNLSDYNLYSELETPVNNVESVTDSGFVLATGGVIESKDVNHPVGLVLIGTEAFQVDMTDAFTGLDSGIVEISKQITGIFEIAHPKPEILVVGLGQKSRILGPETSDYLRSLGMRLQISNTVSSKVYHKFSLTNSLKENGASYFDLLATERRLQVGALMLPPNL